MQKIRIIALDEAKANVIAALHVMGAIDLRKSKLELSDDKPASYSTDVSDSLIKINGALQLLPVEKTRIKHEIHLGAEKAIEEVKTSAYINSIYDLGNERKSISDDQKALDYAEHIAYLFRDVKIDFSRLKSEYLLFRAFETDSRGKKAFIERIEKSRHPYELQVRKSDKKSYAILVAYDRRGNIDDFYKGIKASELDLSARYLAGTPAEVLDSIKKKKDEASRRLQEIEKELARMGKQHYSRLLVLKEVLEVELERSEVSSNFKRTDSTFLIEGWIQKRQVDEVRTRLANVTNSKVVVELMESDELAPTHTRRPKFLQPFDYLVSFYSVQRSDEIDPTWIFILSFPIFYGLMVTDVGYGLASLLLATIIARKTDPEGLMYNAAKVWQLNSFAAIFFGLLSNQWFGFQLNQYIAPFQGFDWLKDTPALIAITVLFGVLQVTLGLAIGVINSRNHGHKKLAVARFASILVVVFGTLAVAGAFFGAFSALITEISGAIAIVSLLATALLSGSEATEITNLITHPLSYARIMGFGLGSVIIAFLIDMAFTPHLSSGPIIFAIYLIIFILLHFLNMLLSIFEGIVQGVRLNFVEFFTKFYIGNGIKFKPFGFKRVYTKE